MLLFNRNLLWSDPLAFFFLIAEVSVALVVAITFHEASHALTAVRLGDATPRWHGRLSLNPLRHLDPLGTVMLFLAGFGWGKPVPVNPYWLRNGRRGMALVAVSGAAANLVVAGVVALPFRLGLLAWDSPLAASSLGGVEMLVASVLGLVIFYNIVLALFNLIPLAPLDGFNVALGILPQDMAKAFAQLERWGPFILFGLIALGYVTRYNLLWYVLGPPINLLGTVLVGKGF